MAIKGQRVLMKHSLNLSCKMPVTWLWAVLPHVPREGAWVKDSWDLGAPCYFLQLLMHL